MRANQAALVQYDDHGYFELDRASLEHVGAGYIYVEVRIIDGPYGSQEVCYGQGLGTSAVGWVINVHCWDNPYNPPGYPRETNMLCKNPSGGENYTCIGNETCWNNLPC